MSFSFYPVGKFLDNHKSCFTNEHGRGDDRCVMDKLGACVVREGVQCMDGNCSAGATAQLVEFLGCFEADHGSNKTVESGRSCAQEVGLDWAPVQRCYDEDGGEAAWNEITEAAKVGPSYVEMKCTPWVVVGGELFSDPKMLQCVKHGDSDRLVQAICARYQGANKPAACDPPVAVVV